MFAHFWDLQTSTVALSKTLPLNDLTRKNFAFAWGTHKQVAFDTLREAFTSAPILALWDPNRPT